MASADTNSEEPLSKRKKLTTEPTSNPSLPHDLLVTCLARASRLHYPTLSFLSKSFQSLITSPELYKTRTLLNCRESCLYVILQFPTDPLPRWFTLYRKPNKTLIRKKKKEESKGFVLAPVSFLNSPPLQWTDLIAVDHYLYAVTQPIKAAPCSNVSFLDCRTHTWLEAPSLRLAHTGGVDCDGDMYLAGSCDNIEALNCVEVFNTKTQTWKPVPPEKQIFKPENMEGKIVMNSVGVSGRKDLTVKPKDMRIEGVGLGMDLDRGSLCMIGNTIFCYYSSDDINWSDTGSGVRGKVEGLDGLPKIAHYSNVRLVDYGGKIVVLWDKYLPASGYMEKMIWCAVISLERRSSEEIWGEVEWFDAVLTVPKSYKFVYAIAATV